MKRKNHLVDLCTEGKDVMGLFILETSGANKGILSNYLWQNNRSKIIRSMEAEVQLYFGLQTVSFVKGHSYFFQEEAL